jgi:NADPH-dependent curcumin reductase CurA
LLVPIDSKRWFIARQPGSELGREDFVLRDVVLAPIGPGEVLVEGRFHLLSPGLRAMIAYQTYAAPVGAGDPVPGNLLGVVSASQHAGFSEGDWVLAPLGWSTRGIAKGEDLTKLDPAIYRDVLPQAALGSLGVNGLTAYIGLFDIGRAQPGETVLISSAAGSVGSVACQLAKLSGCRVVGIAGSDAKCQGLIERFGLDGTVNHSDPGCLAEAIGSACPDGVDVYFDNVGGRTLEAAVHNMNDFGRVVVCGRTATYAEGETKVGGFSPSKRLRFEAFIAFDHAARFAPIRRKMAALIRDGRIKDDYTYIDGIEHSVDQFLALFSGTGVTNPLVRIS